MQTVSRRGLFLVGGSGAAGAMLAGCGGSTDDPRAEGRDPELLATALVAETVLGEAYAVGGEGGAPAPVTAAIESFIAASRKRAERLAGLLEQAGGEAQEAEMPAPGTEIAQGNAAIAAYRTAAGLLSTAQLRGTAIAFLAAVAAELSVTSDFAGEDPAPRAFVTGLPGEPNVAGDQTDAPETTTTTTEEQP